MDELNDCCLHRFQGVFIMMLIVCMCKHDHKSRNVTRIELSPGFRLIMISDSLKYVNDWKEIYSSRDQRNLAQEGERKLDF